eukprot:CAMPEP_0114601936 /NCGR_PEP_ID=MMETSP0125-20121206/24551_1 /TAXON_ID=485358 ORGANISM="Aristerostoma sp., Strain ATCC 50986" /NCGR_SAMPLE_ID=MMETSP0125 /ASSEMBLY_ACC=CAM_ASM_000245 /LENGTH=180 /DNA_ID=CAMNT_0001811655 /DNA_START=743 /DNA_END=1285 /DNA_ORIENTATION=-
MVHYLDNVYDSEWYVKATIGAIEALERHEQQLPIIKKKEEEEEKMLAEMNSKERRNYKKKKEAQEKEEDPIKEKLDFNGKKLIAELKDPLAEATSFAKKLLDVQVTNPKWRTRGFSTLVRLYVRKNKLLLALKAYNKIADFAATDADTHIARIRLVQALEQAVKAEGVNANVKLVFESSL